MSDYINSHVTEIEDLSELSLRIAELEQLKQRIAATAQSKVTTDDTHNDLDSAHAESCAHKITSVLSYALDEGNHHELLANLEGLKQEFGHLEVIRQLTTLLDAKREKTKAIQLIEAARLIESQLQPDMSVLDLKLYAQKTKEIDDGSTLASEVVQILNLALQQIVDQKRALLEVKLTELNEKSGWYSNQPAKSPETFFDLPECIGELIELQAIMNFPVYPDSWWAVDVMLKPVVTRFNFHYNNNKETNNISKPEWALAFVSLFLDNKAGVLDSHFGEVFNRINKFVLFEVITGILKPLRLKIVSMEKSLHKIASSDTASSDDYERCGRLLTHLIYEVAAFDQKIRNQFHYNPYTEDVNQAPKKKWAGLAGDIFHNQDADSSSVKTWLNFENQLANKTFQSEIINSKQALSIDYDYRGANDEENLETTLKPTYSAYALVKLMDTLTSHFQTLGIVKYQLKFVSGVQLTMIDKYCEHLGGLFKTLSETYSQSKMMGLIPGGLSSDNKAPTENNTVVGLKSLQGFTEIYCLAKFILNALEKWSLDLIFVQLWNAFKSASSKSQKEDLSIFDSALKQYDQLTTKVLKKIEEFFKKEIRASLKIYVNSSRWDIPETDDAEASNDLGPLVTVVPKYLKFLEKSVSQYDYHLISDQVVSLISNILYEYIITNHQFTKAGISQFAVDVDYIVSQLHSVLYLDQHRGYSNDENPDFLRLKQSIQFLTDIDAQSAEIYKKSYDFGALRKKHGTSLSALSNSDISDLLLRIL
ncbi:uncharacterized protein CANTADRAFT_52760 [Suhomyces tanzawaensis NRRL Y-17324]|uniref:Uncharacterized protein n=1 Tax=Suhomyces tanzawaensis NRRL Y-17324 TaxID=984487 RepID=A0A1E4SGY1_9ASCO|nr:uncharacterized protein CANTADRAFT_52760 [Suhomyces tanzawaensis NRRL Y-17324]ODV78764.1 hypothetical protein CANTADRAFT_52760 [Suhomyces tanzawaensis NRRL Y-17324]